MSHSRQTEHYNLPLYDGTDIINPLTDFNNANEAIDEAVYNANQRSVQAETTAEEAKDIAEGYDARVTQAIETANSAMTLANNTQDMIAEEFDPMKEGGYKVGDFVIYNGVLYRFINAHTGAWDASDVQASPVLIEAIGEVVDEGKQDIADAVEEAEQEIAGQTEKVTKTQAMIAQPFDENKSGGYAVDDVVTYADKLYKFTSAHSGAWTGLDVEQVNVVELTSFSNVIRLDLDHTATVKTVIADIVSYLQTLGVTNLSKIRDCQLKICLLNGSTVTGDIYRPSAFSSHGFSLESIRNGTWNDINTVFIIKYIEMDTDNDIVRAFNSYFRVESGGITNYKAQITTSEVIYPSTAAYTGAYVEFIWR